MGKSNNHNHRRSTEKHRYRCVGVHRGRNNLSGTDDQTDMEDVEKIEG